MTATRTGTVELWSRQRADLGECPRWDVEEQRLLWVDITAGQVLATREDETALLLSLPGRASAVAQRSAGGLLAAGDTGLLLLDEDGARREIPIETCSTPRCLNDGAVDVAGRLWIGSAMVDQRALPSAALFRVDAAGCAAMVGGVAMGNGIAWAPDDRLLYFVDSGPRRIDVFDFDAEYGTIGAARPFATIPDGLPDGIAVDADGCVWVAVWGAGEVRRFDPDGRLLRRVRVPASQPSSCTFAGPELRDLLITTARMGLEDPDGREPLAGSIFCLPDAGVGRAPFRTIL